jgi:hypothetical protein
MRGCSRGRLYLEEAAVAPPLKGLDDDNGDNRTWDLKSSSSHDKKLREVMMGR